jgi:hypothetical protein
VADHDPLDVLGERVYALINEYEALKAEQEVT